MGTASTPKKGVTTTNPPPGYNTVSPYLIYEDADRAVDYLTQTFGFHERLAQPGASGRTHHELVIGHDGLVMLGQGSDKFQSLRSLDVYPPALIHVYVGNVDELHERAMAAGADVTELEMAPAGDRRFTATDPEGQMWVFAQRVR
jgi:uncharacterized glyoxalase superfamily protein PhnB